LQPRYAQDLKIDDDKTSNLIGIMSVGSTFGRLFFGKLSDHPRVNRLYLYQMSFFCIGAIQTLVPQITNFAGFAMYMVSFGVFDGCFIVLLAIVVSDVVGIDKVSTGMGVKFFFMAITTFVGPPLAGKCSTNDRDGSVNISESQYLREVFYTLNDTISQF
jgi:MCP family monocarboxylic acid transporter-like MFS transporter 10